MAAEDDVDLENDAPTDAVEDPGDAADGEGLADGDGEGLADGDGDGDTEGRAGKRQAPTSHMTVPDAPQTALPKKVEAWRRRSAAGAILTGFAFGLREVFEENPKEPAIVMETSGDPPTDLPVEALIDQLPPKRSVVQVRPWLLPDSKAAAEEENDVQDEVAAEGQFEGAEASDRDGD